MITMQSNKYTYPYTPFRDLFDKKLSDNFRAPRHETWDAVAALLARRRLPAPVPAGNSAAERVFSMFLDDEVLFGSPEYVLDMKEDWLRRFRRFTDADEPLQFVLLGFPFKIPVPLKTDRVLPDMGEMLILRRLDNLLQAIREAYPPGAVLTNFTEGAFGKSEGVPAEECTAYAHFLGELARMAGLKDMIFKDLSDMEATAPDFEARYAEKIARLETLYVDKDAAFLEKYQGTYPSMYRIISTKGVPVEVLMDVYNEAIIDRDLPPDARQVREDLRRRAHEAIIAYHAYLGMRDDIGYIEKEVPGALHLSVAPKPGRLGIIPIGRDCIRLPYHGIPVYDPARDAFSIEYLIDVQRDTRAYTPVYLEEDREEKPFYYVLEG